MATPDVIAGKHKLDEVAAVPRKRFKASDLPLTSAQKSSIDSILHTIKKKGEYDTLRKKVWSQFAESEERTAFIKSLNDLAEAEIDRDPSLLSRDRHKAATLVQGAVDRSDIYKTIEKTLDELIDKNINHLLKAVREIRRAEVGEEAATEEEKRGSKTDEEYAQESIARREKRAIARKKEEAEKIKREKKEQLEQLKADEARTMAELEKLRNDSKLRTEREARRSERGTDADRRRREKQERDKDLEKEKHRPRDSEPAAIPATSVTPVDEKALEEAALALLLQEGRELAVKNTPKIERDRSDSPHRKARVSPPKGPAADRNRTIVKPDHRPRLAYSSAPTYQGSPIPPLSAHAYSRSRSPFRASSIRRDRSRSTSRTRQQSYSIRDDERRREVESEAKPALMGQMPVKWDTDSEAPRARGRLDHDDVERPSRSLSRGTDKDSLRDRVQERSKPYDYDYDYDYDRARDRERDYRRRDEGPHSRKRERHRYDDRPYNRPRREEAPEHIDRYVPGGPAPSRDRDRDTRERETRDKDTGEREPKDREDRESKDGDSKPKERSTRERSSYYDTERERRYYKDDDCRRSEYRDKERGSERPRDRDRDRDRDREDRYSERDRDRRDNRPYVSRRRDEAPEHIDRYVPGGDNRDRERDRGRDRDRSR